jgi:exopolyphosphatase
MTLLQFLRQACQLHRQFISGAVSESPVYVIGNPSADLDSIVSAIVYSFCANNRLPLKAPRPHIPLLNLSNVPAGPELYRLRPEFATALWQSTNFPALNTEEQFENAQESAGTLLREHLVTVADFAQDLKEQNVLKQLLADATLVDWNALPIPSNTDKGYGSLSGLPGVTFRTLGCIDHHIDENFMQSAELLPENQPLTIQPGPGSCASLITRELQNRTLMGDGQVFSAEMAQVAKLALSAVLIDTSNLTAEGKVTDVDREAVRALRSQIGGQLEKSKASQNKWDLRAFYEDILNAKQNSLDLLNLEEVLDRDYKDWTETPQSSEKAVKIGFCSSVKPIRWIVQKAGTPEKFLDAVGSFAARAEKKLDVVVVMTAFTAADGSFYRELFACVVSENKFALEGVEAFVEQTTSQLKLVDWAPLDGEDVSELGDVCSALNGSDTPFWRRLWIQKNAAGSRKQVAPLLRSAVSKI